MTDTTANFRRTRFPFKKQIEQVEKLLANAIDGNGSPLEKALSTLISKGGKRIRPRIALLTGYILQANEYRLLHMAAAVELLHAASLIHDDISDKALLRRGEKTINANWSTTISVLAGDLVLTKAIRLVQDAHSHSVMDMFIETMNRMVSGELKHLVYLKSATDRKAYFTWIGAKTAALFGLAACAPVRLGTTDKKMGAAAYRFGYNVGMAYQIVDDVLDFTGNCMVLGKPVGSDLCQGVLTLPALLYRDAHPGDPDLQTIIAGKKIDDAGLRRILHRIRSSNSIEEAMEMARGFVHQGLDSLNHLPNVPERDFLTELAESIIARNK